MTHDARLQQLGIPLHVIAQALELRSLFLDDVDRARFLRRARDVFAEMQVTVLAWALMDNHVHFALLPSREPVSTAMQRVLGPYAQAFNRRHDRVGPLFRGRFWSRPIDGDRDLMAVLAYITRNPLTAGVVEDVDALARHPWTSLHELLAPAPHPDRLVDLVGGLAPFGRDVESARARLLTRLAWPDPELASVDALDEPRGPGTLPRRSREDLEAPGLLALRMRSAQVDAALAERHGVAARRERLVVRGWTVDRVVRRAAAICHADEHLLRAGARRDNESTARALVACFGGLYLRVGDTALARATGISRQAVPRARTRGVGTAAARGMTWRDFFDLPATDSVPSA